MLAVGGIIKGEHPATMHPRILVVAQDVMLRSTLARWLMPAGYFVELAENDRTGQASARGSRQRKSRSPSRAGYGGISSGHAPPGGDRRAPG